MKSVNGVVRTLDTKSPEFAQEFPLMAAAFEIFDSPLPPPRPEKPTPEGSRVYVLGGEGFPFVKIGYSRCPESRIASIQVGCPIPLAVLASCAGGCRLENMAHKTFGAFRAHGEWFHRTPEVEEWMAAVNGRSEKTAKRITAAFSRRAA